MAQGSNRAGGLMPDTCHVVLVFQGPAIQGNMKRRAWCITHDRFAEECEGDPFDTLEHLEADAVPAVKRCKRCGAPIER
jgi:heterodisulfide reductase subunit A-like polyferredoxin